MSDKTPMVLIEKALRVSSTQVPTITMLASYIIDDLGANGYVVLPRELLDELVDAWTNDGNITRCDNAAQALVAAVVEAVGPTREDTSNG